MSQNPAKQRLRITFGKFSALRYTSNLDLAKTWERVLRRANLPLLYTQGFNTRPRLQLASALPLGISSECELLDIFLREEIALEGLREALTAVSPEGLKIYNIESVDISGPALQTQVRSALYSIHFPDGLEDTAAITQRITVLMAQSTLIIHTERKGRPVEKDLRPLVFDLQLVDDHHCTMHIAVGDQANVRPRDIIALLDLQDVPHTVHRQTLYLE